MPPDRDRESWRCDSRRHHLPFGGVRRATRERAVRRLGRCLAVLEPAGGSERNHRQSDSGQNLLFLHEILHQYEGNQQSYHSLYIGAEGLRGSEEHGFPNATVSEGWNEWYRTFLRGQAGELVTMRPGITLQTPPTNPSYCMGTFSSMKYGMRSPAPR